MTQSVNGVNNAGSNKQVKVSRQSELTVRTGESLSVLAQKFGMSQKEFMEWTGLKSANLKAGQKIKLPTATVPSGRGIMAVARDSGMTFADFCKLNNIPKTYTPSKGEIFYVKRGSVQKTSATQSETPSRAVTAKTVHPKNAQQTKSKATPTKTASRAAKPSPAGVNKMKYGSSYTPDELGKRIYQKSEDYYGAVGKPDFDALLNEINPKNVESVLKSYKNNPKNTSKESLINTLTSEISSDKNKRKAAVMKVYDTLARAKGTPASVRANFAKELDRQFNSIGMVSTSKLDETMNRMMATPSELATKMKSDIDTKSGAIGQSSFQELLSLVNSKNASAVIKSYDKISKGSSLIKDITHEIGNNKDVRKKAVMHIYDSLAKQKNTPPSHRAAFVQELNNQFNSWGMVDTKKMDSMIAGMLRSEYVDSAQKASAPKKTVTPKGVKIAPNERYVPKGFEVAVGGKRSVASTGALPSIPINDKGEVIAEVIKFKPSNPNGPLKGKTIMVNAGHGWGENKNFKPGTRATDSNGKTIPEWYKNRNFADQLIKQLSSQGATVVYTAGDAKPVCNAKRKYKADMLISLHCNASSNKDVRGLDVYYAVGSNIGKKFANIAEKHLDTLVSFGKQGGENDHCRTRADNEGQHTSIGILQVNKEKTPSILIEMGYQSNETDLRNIDSANFRQNSMRQVTNAVKEYFNVK